MKVLELNNTDLFSTGNIMLNTANVARSRGHEVLTASKYCKMSIDRHREDCQHYYIGNRAGNTLHRYWAWMTDMQDTGSVFSTLRFLREVDRFKPNLVHLHDILGWYLNIGILFSYIKRKNLPVIWTFHDCWAFTGRCIYFDSVHCDKWKTGCGSCPQKGYMPGTWWFDRSRWNFKRKERLFTSIEKMTIVTPSQWLADLTKQSFLRKYPVEVINNGIDLQVFKPTEGDIYQDLKQTGKKIILGVAGTWSKRKGLDDFVKLSMDLPDDYMVVLVGLSKNEVPENSKIRAIERTHNKEELAQVYTAADVFANPTYEDNFPTVNLESLACGTPVVTYRTGGSPESIQGNNGSVVDQGDCLAFKDALIRIVQEKSQYMSDYCVKSAKKYAMQARFNDYIDLFEKVVND